MQSAIDARKSCDRKKHKSMMFLHISVVAIPDSDDLSEGHEFSLIAK